MGTPTADDPLPEGPRDHHLRPVPPAVLGRGRRSGGAHEGLRPVSRLPAVRQPLQHVPHAVRAHRPRQRPGRHEAHEGRAGPGRRRVLPVQALLPQLPVRPGPERVEPGLPPADAAGRCHAHGNRRRPGPAPAHQQRDGPHRPGRQARCPGRTARQRHRREAGLGLPQGPPGADRGVGGAGPAALRQAAVHHVVQAAPEGADRAPAGQGGRVPHLPRRVPEPGHRPRPREGVRAQRRGVRGRRQGQVLRSAVVARRRGGAVHQAGPGERRPAGRRRAGRQRHRRRPTDVRVRAQAGLRRLRRRRRRHARGEADLRRRPST